MLFSGCLYSFFFRNLKVAPKPNWIKRAASLGLYEPIKILRAKVYLIGYCIRPIASHSDRLVKRVVIFSHPLLKKSKYFFSDSGHVKLYLDQGYTVLAFDYNGFGESDFIDLYYWKDVESIIQFVKERFPQADICLHGISFGAFQVIPAINYLPKGSNVVLENVNKNLYGFWKSWPLARRVIKLLEFIKFRPIMDMNVFKIIAELNRPDLTIKFIACKKDQVTTPEEINELYLVLVGAQKNFILFEMAGHLTALSAEPELFKQVVFN